MHHLISTLLLFVASYFIYFYSLILFTTKKNTGIYVQVSLPQWKYILRNCNDYLKYEIPSLESDESYHSPRIKFHIYEVVTIFSKDGVVEPSNLLCDVFSNSDCNEDKRNQ